MKLVRYNPLNELDFWNTSFDRFFNSSACRTDKAASFHPAVDIVDGKENVVLNVELPGMDKKDIQVNIEDRVLTISGERKKETRTEEDNWTRTERTYGSFKRAFTLSDSIVTDEVSADYKGGILSITLKKDAEKEEVRQITIN